MGDRVLVHQEKTNKLSTPFNPTPLTVASKTRNSLVIEADDGTQYSRNASHVRMFLEPESENVRNDPRATEASTAPPTLLAASAIEAPKTPMKQIVSPRCQRERRIPKR